jgi:hypothetical protein
VPAPSEMLQRRAGLEPGEDNWPPLQLRLAETRAALQRLQATIRDQCPGQHEYVKHSDGRFPYCEACRYTDCGLRLSELGSVI